MRRTLMTLCAAAALAAGWTGLAGAGAQAGDPAPNFTKNDLAGVPHSLTDWAGKVVFLFELGYS